MCVYKLGSATEVHDEVLGEQRIFLIIIIYLLFYFFKQLSALLWITFVDNSWE